MIRRISEPGTATPLKLLKRFCDNPFHIHPLLPLKVLEKRFSSFSKSTGGVVVFGLRALHLARLAPSDEHVTGGCEEPCAEELDQEAG